MDEAETRGLDNASLGEELAADTPAYAAVPLATERVASKLGPTTALIGLHLVCGVLYLLCAVSVLELGVIWWVGAGILIGFALCQRPSRFGYVLAALTSLTIPATVAIRALPIHSLDWRGIDTVKVSRLAQDWSITITDPNELAAFEEFGSRGTYKTMIKSGYGYDICVGNHGSSTHYYVHGSALGPLRGGYVQTVFVPRRGGFQQFFEGLLTKYGHPAGRSDD